MRVTLFAASLLLLAPFMAPAGCSLSMERYDTRAGLGGSPAGGSSSIATSNSGGFSAGGQSSSGGKSTGGAVGTGGAPLAEPTCEESLSDDAGASDAGATMEPKWDWVGIIGTGQSLSVGTTPVTSKTQPYNNLKLSLGSVKVPPWDTTDKLDTMALVPLTEPIRPEGSGFPRPYPGNIWGESPHSAMANAVTHLVKCDDPGKDYVTVHTVVGESGQGIEFLRKVPSLSKDGLEGFAYAATLFEVTHITRLAKAAGKSYGVGAVMMTHGETDSGNGTYKDQLIQLLNDYNDDISAITGQTARFPMYLSQQHAYPNGYTTKNSVADYSSSKGQRPLANIVQWQLGVDHKGDFVCVGPQYQYEANHTTTSDTSVHLSALGYQMLGEKNAQVYFQREVLGHDWQPLQPTTVERSGRSVIVHFNVPVPPLNWDGTFDSPAITEWVKGRGFELRTASKNVTIASVAIQGDSVVVTSDSDLPASGLVVGYALSSQGVQMKQASKSVRWGQLRDSDPFVGGTSKHHNPNYALSFEMAVP
jgi:hypothetical protein